LGRWGLSSQELSRVEVMGRVKAGSLRLQEAAELLGLSYRQAKRVWARYRGGGAKALQHGNCGRISNRAHPEEFRQAVLVQVGRRYADFGPTLAAEHLEEEDGLQVAAETLRRWMKAAGLWRRQRARKPYRQRRMRKPHFGELVQLDASFHPWLEDRAANGCLMHMVDDAIGTVLCQFSAGETTWAAAHLLRAWFECYGVPRALYTDWKNVYVRTANAQERLRGTKAVTQFGQMCAKLGIRIIAASSPQAKGRIEWVHGTHQDRLVKKLRLAGVSHYEAANAYLQEHYIAQHNHHYARPATAEADYHRQRPTARQLDEVFWLEQERVLSADWWCVTKTTCCNSRGRIVTGRRPRAGCWCGRIKPETSHSLSRTESALSRTLCRRYGAERGKRRCPFPRVPASSNIRPTCFPQVQWPRGFNEKAFLDYGIFITLFPHLHSSMAAR